MSKQVERASVVERAKQLDDQAVVDLIKAMFQSLREDYVGAINYLDEHPDEPCDTEEKVEAFALKRECEDFTKTPLYRLITDLDGKELLASFLEAG